jgi:probable F420-dependent oxidoreductase
MQFGVILRNYGDGAKPAEMRKSAELAERLGFASVWTTDHILLPASDADRFGNIFEAVLSLAWLSGFTHRIRLGVSSLVLPQRDPVLVAKQMATLDRLSGGRAMLCVGVGWSRGEYLNLGQEFRDRGARMDEALQVLKLLWAAAEEEPVTYQGQHYHIQDGVFAPPSMQPGGPVLWIGGRADAALRRAADADGWHPSGVTPQEIAVGVERLLALRADREITISARLRLSMDGSDATAPLHGKPAAVISQLREYQSAGLEYAVIDFLSTVGQARRDMMAQFAESVLPAMTGDGQ